MNEEEFVYHYDKWWWGKSVHVVSHNGHGICEVQFDDDFPEIAFVRGLSVTEEYRGKGVATSLLQECERLARNNGRNIIKLDAERDGWCCGWYKRLGFIVLKTRKRIYEMQKIL